MTNLNIQNEIVEARKRWNFDKEDKMLLLCGITCELGELASAIRNKYIYNKPDIPEEDKSSLKHEMADVAIYLYALAQSCDIDLNEAILSKIKINDKRFIK